MQATSDLDFSPNPLIAGGNTQTLLPRVGPGMLRSIRLKKLLSQTEQHHIINCGAIADEKNVRLLGVYNPPVTLNSKQSSTQHRALVILLPGWEGSYNSTYMLTMTQTLQQHGFAVLRLHMRDHGPSHHLNRAVFHSARIAEVIAAIQQVIIDFPASRYALCGFSLGGNFALRVAASQQAKLDHILAINPLFDPQSATQAVMSNPIYHQYFLKKWKRSLLLKGTHFKGLLDSSSVIHSKNYLQLTEYMLANLTPFSSIEDYYSRYTISQSLLEKNTTALDIFISKNDPVIPFNELGEIKSTPNNRLHITTSGGHCGYQQNILGSNWVDQQALKLLKPLL